MQAVIMAAGRGKRISQFIGDKPKCFLEIGGKRIIDYQLDILNDFGIKDVIMVVGYKKDLIVEEYSDRNIRFVFNPFYETTNVLTSFWFAKDRIVDDFAYLHGDTIFDIRIFEDMFKKEGDIVLPIERKTCEEEEMKVIVKDSQVVKISKELIPQESYGEFIGIAKISKNVMGELTEIVDEFMVEKKFNLFFEAAIQELINRNKCFITYTETKNYFWNEIDFYEDLKNAREEITRCRMSPHNLQ